MHISYLAINEIPFLEKHKAVNFNKCHHSYNWLLPFFSLVPLWKDWAFSNYICSIFGVSLHIFFRASVYVAKKAKNSDPFCVVSDCAFYDHRVFWRKIKCHQSGRKNADDGENVCDFFCFIEEQGWGSVQTCCGMIDGPLWCFMSRSELCQKRKFSFVQMITLKYK